MFIYHHNYVNVSEFHCFLHFWLGATLHFVVSGLVLGAMRAEYDLIYSEGKNNKMWFKRDL